MKLYTQVRKYGAQIATVGAGSLFLSLPAFAAIDEAVTTALTALKADVITISTAAFAVLLVIVAYRYFKRAT